jgi:acetoin utilization deacetylase AcuC-like enzyme
MLRIRRVQHATVVVHEGGYRTRTLGRNAQAFFAGLIAGSLGRGIRKERTGR